MELRPTGIDVIGDVPWGTHFCQFYGGKQDLVDILVPYFRAGLANDEACVWVTSPPLEVAEARDALRRGVPELEQLAGSGRLEILPHTECYLKGGRFDPDRVLRGWLARLEDARSRGFPGLRLSGNTFWLERSDWQSFAEYEAAVNAAFGGRPVLALCTYALDRCGASDLTEVVRSHAFALMRRDGQWERFEREELRESQLRELARREARLVHAEQELRESEARLRRSQEIAHLGSWELDLVSGLLTWSDEVYRIFGQKPQEFAATYQAFLEAVHPDDRAAVDAAYSGSLREGRDSYEIEHRVLRRSTPEVRVVHEKCQHFRDASGRIIRSVGMVHDVTERRRAEDALRESARLHSILLRTTRQGYWLFDAEGRLLEVNEAYCAMSGYSEAELLAMRVSDLEAVESAEEVARHLQLVREEGHAHFETRHRRKDGTVFDAEIRTTFLDVDGGRWVVFIWDISGRKAAERALREADRRKDELLALLAHELRNPLAPILSSVEIIRRAADNVELSRRAQAIIEKQVHHMARLIDDLLDVSRISQGKIVLQRELAALEPIVGTAVETSLPAIEAGRHHLSVDLPAEPIRVLADKVRLAQVLTNVLNNAAKYSLPQGRIELTAAQEAEQVIIRVKDRGVGIDPEMLPRVFELFVQGDPSPKKERGGLGVGLALSRRLVELHGGTIEVTSAGEGLGTEVVLRLPAAPAPHAVVEPSPAAPAPGAAARFRVLVVDDSVDAADSMSALLSLMGHEVSTAHSGPAALELASAFRPDIVLLDLGMPEMTGYEVATRLRQSEAGQCAVIVAMTGWGQEEDRRRTSAAGFDHHLVKPVALEQLEQVFSQLLGDGADRSRT